MLTRSVLTFELIVKIDETVAWPPWIVEFSVCRSGAPGIWSSIARTIESRMTVGEAPLYWTLTVTVGCETFGEYCRTSVDHAIEPATAMSAKSTKTSVGRRTKRPVNHIN